MKKIFPLSLALILCAPLAFSQQSLLIQTGSTAEPPAASVVVDDAPALQWELVNPFRFIRHQNSVDELRRVYDGLKLDENGEKTAYNLERELQKLADEVVAKNREAERQRLKCDTKQSETERKKCLDEAKKPYLGWFAHLAQNNYSRTCWDSQRQQFRDDVGCKDYIHPKSHKVRVWISNSQLLGGRVPQWLIDNQPLPKSEKCSEAYQKGVCVEFDVEYNESKAREISARFSDGSFTIAPLAVLVKDKLIVGLGDSYAAGEGNPDIPAQFVQGRAEKDGLLDFEIREAPRKDKDTEVGWLDRRCHRSMYSYQFKTALHLALANPQEAITYVSYSCSGATTDNIIDRKQKPNEGGGKVNTQLETLRKVLEDGKNGPRKIDYLLLSTGGNDVGFAKFVAYVVTTGLALKIIARGINEEELKKSGAKFRETLLSGSKGNYPRLHVALLDTLKGIKIKDCEPGKPCKRILLTPYPDIFKDERSEPCRAERREFDVPFREDKTRAERIKLVRQYVFDPLNEIQLKLFPADLGWTIVKSHFDQYAKHGFCAQDTQSASLTGEKFVIPTRRNKDWQPFDPRDYRAYEARQRWIRLPVDSKLTTDQVHIILKKISLDLLFEDDSSNIMHPTAEGLATHADANFKEIQRQEGKVN